MDMHGDALDLVRAARGMLAANFINNAKNKSYPSAVPMPSGQFKPTPNASSTTTQYHNATTNTTETAAMDLPFTIRLYH